MRFRNPRGRFISDPRDYARNVGNNVGRLCTLTRKVWFQTTQTAAGNPRCWIVVADDGATLKIRAVDGAGHVWGIAGTVRLAEITSLY